MKSMAQPTKLSLFAILLLVIAFIGCEIKDNDNGDYIYDIADGKVRIQLYCGKEKDLIIPETLKGFPVHAIINAAFYGKQLQGVTLPNELRYIDTGAFRYNELTSIVIPYGVASVGDMAFAENKLESVSIPDSITDIKTNTFYLNKLKSISIPDSVKSIGYGALSHNELTDVKLSASLLNMGTNAFSFNQITQITIPGGVMEIPPGAFCNNKLTELTIPENVLRIGQGAFENNVLTEVTIFTKYNPELPYDQIGHAAFAGSQISRIFIRDNISMDDEAFENGFAAFYAENGKKEGHYSYIGGKWGFDNG